MLFVKKHSDIVDRIEIHYAKEHTDDTAVRISIYITEDALNRAYLRYLKSPEDVEGIDNINDFAETEELENEIGDMLGINIYNELNSILSYVFPKYPIPVYDIDAPLIDEEE